MSRLSSPTTLTSRVGKEAFLRRIQSRITTRERFLGASGLRFFLTPVKKPRSCAGTMKGASVASSGPSKASSKSKSLEIGRATSELQSHVNLVCRLLLEKKKKKKKTK